MNFNSWVMKNTFLSFVLLLTLVLGVQHARGQGYTPSPENLAAREWFDQAGFGLFIHWGGYCILGDCEWGMNN